ncbi:isopentenyl transferase family protein [Mesorhizobium sp. WSM1293]|uniref:isopentenyl transferase family protein n=1 Tax=Mesorhizobium sp. WSM1293 TaxID=1040984 RepID=UPI0004858D8D|nr:isopentenyl transferase family protein [Mesorhizobium sp. WSM1293]
MSPRLHLIIGPTTAGKTVASLELAQRTGAPVLVLDRIQCYPELAVGSGRPSNAELRFTRRIYLAQRPVIAGEIYAAEANSLLHDHVAQFDQHVPLLILEGGSVSLLRAMVADQKWKSHRWTYERLHLKTRADYIAKARSRVREMLAPVNGCRSMLNEIAQLWPDPRSHVFLRGLAGYRTVIAYAETLGIALGDLPRAIQPTQIVYLSQAIALEYLAHARWQEREFPCIPAAWKSGR